MLDRVFSVIHYCSSQVTHLERTHWVLLSILVCVVGFICMRGFGSRTNY